jgi:lipopolysaccharide/colanic/teichoic acid biosynthesis glycosyltransferase
VAVFFIAGLYEERRILFGSRSLSTVLLYAQFANIVIAALFFFLIPTYGLAPKTVLLIYLLISSPLIFVWRSRLFPLLGLQRSESALVIGVGPEIEDLVHALNSSPFSPVRVAEIFRPDNPDLRSAVEAALTMHHPRFIIADFESLSVVDAFPQFYNLLAEGVRFIDAAGLYEDVFGRVPLTRVSSVWIARHITLLSHFLYDPLKRVMDVVTSLIAGAVSLAAYPFIIAAIKLDDGGPVFIFQDRIGQAGQPIRLCKFRTMTGNDSGEYGAEGTTSLRVTRVGRFLRVTRLDELPQLWNVILGDLSLIGPRPELPALVARYEEQIPFYGIRHLVRPGVSGWAQIYHDNHPHHGEAVEATREKLAYDLYYLKHRSIMLDLIIALKTIAKLLTRSGV